MKKVRERKIKHKYKKQQIIIICVIAIYFVAIVSVLGRYAVNNINNFFSKSKEFYFYSDKLTEKNNSYQIDNWSGVDNYTIVINMNSNENNLLSCSYDIDYDISYTCSDKIICQLNKTSGTIYANTNKDYFNLTITPNQALVDGDKVYVEITAKTTSPYQKTLKGKFTLRVGKEKLSYEIVDSENSPYMELNITNTLSYYIVDTAFDTYRSGEKINIDTYLALTEDKKQKCYSAFITLQFDPKKVVLDTTSSEYLSSLSTESTTINSSNYIKNISFKIDAISSSTVRFYKIDQTKDYTYPITNSDSIVTVISK